MDVNKLQTWLWPSITGIAIIGSFILIYTANKKLREETVRDNILISKVLLQLIYASISLAIGIYCLNHAMKLGFEQNLTAYIAIIGGIPTIYLWIIRERKKEQDLKNKDIELNNKKIELNQIKIAELNKIYVDAINQFYSKEQFLAGAYALSGLIEDWMQLETFSSSDFINNTTKIEQISSIIFSKFQSKKHNILFSRLVSRIVQKLIYFSLKRNNWDERMEIPWQQYNLSGIDLSNMNLSNYTRIAS